jgi:branched-chain amino acid transport system substrate-binding protein
MATQHCPYCGVDLARDARYCDHCGTPLHETRPRGGSRQVGRITAWVFLLVALLLFGGGTVGGFFYKAQPWKDRMVGGQVQAPQVEPVDLPFNRVLTDAGEVSSYLRGVVSINVRGEQGNKTGSGFIIDDQGHVVTAAHVVEGASGCVTITDDNGRAHQGALLQRDSNLDAALLRVPSLKDWTGPLSISSAKGLKAGDEVFVLGSPKGVGNTVPLSAAVVRTGEAKVIDGRFFSGLVQVSGAVVLEGTSGGPLIEKSTGGVVGLVNAGSGGPVAWAVPSDQFLTKLSQWAQAPDPASCRSQVAAQVVPVSLVSITPLSGAYGVEGTDVADGMALAIRDMEVALRQAGYAVTLKRLDDRNEAAIAREMADRAAYDPTVIGVVGSLESQVTAAIADQLVDSGVVLIEPTGGGEDLASRSWPHVNRLVANATRQEESLARFARDRLRAGSLFALSDTTADSAARTRSFGLAAEALGLSTVGTVQLRADANVDEIITQIRESKASVVHYSGAGGELLPLLEAMRQAELRIPILGGEALLDRRFASMGGTDGPPIYFTRLTAEPSQQFQRAFEDVQGKPTRGYAAYGYDAASVILGALLRYGEQHPSQVPGRNELSTFVRATKGHPGWSAWITFGPHGENETAWVHLYQWESGAARLRESLK